MLKTDRIVLSDGRRGWQTCYRETEGQNWQLSEVVIDREADGAPCRHVYARRPDLQARVYSLNSLGHVTWEIVG